MTYPDAMALGLMKVVSGTGVKVARPACVELPLVLNTIRYLPLHPSLLFSANI